MINDYYARFLESKRVKSVPTGFEVSDSDINPMLFPFQKDVLLWDLWRGKAANFMATGTGKGPIQLCWCQHVSTYTGGETMILAPLAVAQQFEREAHKFHVPLTVCLEQSDVRQGVNVTNYDRLDHFNIEAFAGVSLDESSCIKDWTSKTCQTLIERLRGVAYKLCSTATPSPNDHTELGTHAELLDVMTRASMLSMFFEHDGGDTGRWEIKGHGKKPFFYWLASWSVCVALPSDLGYPDEGFELLPLHVIEHIVPVDHTIASEGMLFRAPDLSATGLHKEMRLTAAARDRKSVV